MCHRILYEGDCAGSHKNCKWLICWFYDSIVRLRQHRGAYESPKRSVSLKNITVIHIGSSKNLCIGGYGPGSQLGSDMLGVSTGQCTAMSADIKN